MIIQCFHIQLEEFEGYKSIDKKAITIDGLKENARNIHLITMV